MAPSGKKEARSPRFSVSKFFSGKNLLKSTIGVGSTVWLRDDSVCYAKAEVTEVNGPALRCVLPGDKQPIDVPLADAYPWDQRDEAEADLVQMGNVDTPNILNTLQAHHKKGAVYTNVGSQGILISINPYEWIDIYGVKLMREYYEGFSTSHLSPHVFAMASDAYKALCCDGTSQCIVTSGESGSGKTENSKQVFRFLAEVAGSQTGAAGGGVPMQDLLIKSSPLLEAFGNSKAPAATRPRPASPQPPLRPPAPPPHPPTRSRPRLAPGTRPPGARCATSLGAGPLSS